MKKWTSSNWISLIIILLIPISWVVQYALNLAMVNYLVKTFGTTVLDFADIESKFGVLFIAIPLSQLVLLATMVIPAIFLRKAVREGTTNLTMPVGKNATDKIKEPTPGNRPESDMV